MFKLGSSEKELFENMKKNLGKNASDMSNEKEKHALKVAQNLDIIGTLLDQNNFPVQAHVITKFLEKKATKDQVINSFDKSFNDRANTQLKEKLHKLFIEASFNEKNINKMIQTPSNKFNNLFTISNKRSLKSFGESEKPINDFFNKTKSVVENKYLRILAELSDPLEDKINFEDELELNDNDFEDD